MFICELHDVYGDVADLYCDVYGYKPDASWYRGWNAASEEVRQAVYQDLTRTSQERVRVLRDQKNRAVAAWENLIGKLISRGATSRTQAIRWIAESEDTKDMEYLCHLYDLPMGYLSAD